MKIFLIVFWLLFSIFAWSQKPAETNTAKSENPKRQGQSQNAVPNNPVLPLNITLAQDHRAEGGGCCKEKDEHGGPETLTAGATVALAFITALLALFTYRLWISTRKLVKDAKETSKRQLRAYLGIIKADIFPDQGNIFAFIKVTNTGQTPAHRVKIRLNAQYLGETPNENIFNNLEDSGGSWIMIPGANWSRESEAIAGGPADDAKTAAGVWVWGDITYKDSFGENCIIEFRYKGGERFPNTIDGHLVYCWRLIPDAKHYTAKYGDETPS